MIYLFCFAGEPTKHLIVGFFFFGDQAVLPALCLGWGNLFPINTLGSLLGGVEDGFVFLLPGLTAHI